MGRDGYFIGDICNNRRAKAYQFSVFLAAFFFLLSFTCCKIYRYLDLLVWFLMEVKRTLFSMLIGSVFSTGVMRKETQFVRFVIR